MAAPAAQRVAQWGALHCHYSWSERPASSLSDRHDILGGTELEPNSRRNSCPQVDHWRALPGESGVRGRGAAVRIEGAVCGGRAGGRCDGTTHLASVECYDPVANEWRTLPSMRSAKALCAAAVGDMGAGLGKDERGRPSAHVLDEAEPELEARGRQGSAVPGMGLGLVTRRTRLVRRVPEVRNSSPESGSGSVQFGRNSGS